MMMFESLTYAMTMRQSEILLRLVDLAFVWACYRIYKIFKSLEVTPKEVEPCNRTDAQMPEMDETDSSIATNYSEESSDRCSICLEPFKDGSCQLCSCDNSGVSSSASQFGTVQFWFLQQQQCDVWFNKRPKQGTVKF